jgi:hypothetical protein
MRTDWWTRMTKLRVAFRNSVKAPKNCFKSVAAGSYKILTIFQGHNYTSTSLRTSWNRIKNSVTVHVYVKHLENSPVSRSTYTPKTVTLKSVGSKNELLDSGLVSLCRCSLIEKRHTYTDMAAPDMEEAKGANEEQPAQKRKNTGVTSTDNACLWLFP